MLKKEILLVSTKRDVLKEAPEELSANAAKHGDKKWNRKLIG